MRKGNIALPAPHFRLTGELCKGKALFSKHITLSLFNFLLYSLEIRKLKKNIKILGFVHLDNLNIFFIVTSTLQKMGIKNAEQKMGSYNKCN